MAASSLGIIECVVLYGHLYELDAVQARGDAG